MIHETRRCLEDIGNPLNILDRPIAYLLPTVGAQVLLLEAGTEEPDVAAVPGLAPLLQGSSIDWNYRTQPEHHGCRSRRDGGCQWARGKVLGGSSSINYMIYTRGNPRDYDEWAEMGNEGKIG